MSMAEIKNNSSLFWIVTCDHLFQGLYPVDEADPLYKHATDVVNVGGSVEGE